MRWYLNHPIGYNHRQLAEDVNTRIPIYTLSTKHMITKRDITHLAKHSQKMQLTPETRMAFYQVCGYHFVTHVLSLKLDQRCDWQNQFCVINYIFSIYSLRKLELSIILFLQKILRQVFSGKSTNDSRYHSLAIASQTE